MGYLKSELGTVVRLILFLMPPTMVACLIEPEFAAWQSISSKLFLPPLLVHFLFNQPIFLNITPV